MHYLQLFLDELTQIFKTNQRNNKLADLSSLGWILCEFLTRRLEKHVQFVAKKLEKYIISAENRLGFLIHTAGHPASTLSLIWKSRSVSNIIF